MSDPLPYATPAGRAPNPIGAGIVLGLLALGLIALGGCFMIGIGSMYDIFAFALGAPSRAWTEGEVIFATALYLAAAACFGAAVFLLVLAVKRLLAA